MKPMIIGDEILRDKIEIPLVENTSQMHDDSASVSVGNYEKKAEVID